MGLGGTASGCRRTHLRAGPAGFQISHVRRGGTGQPPKLKGVAFPRGSEPTLSASLTDPVRGEDFKSVRDWSQTLGRTRRQKAGMGCAFILRLEPPTHTETTTNPPPHRVEPGETAGHRRLGPHCSDCVCPGPGWGFRGGNKGGVPVGLGCQAPALGRGRGEGNRKQINVYMCGCVRVSMCPCMCVSVYMCVCVFLQDAVARPGQGDRALATAVIGFLRQYRVQWPWSCG